MLGIDGSKSHPNTSGCPANSDAISLMGISEVRQSRGDFELRGGHYHLLDDSSDVSGHSIERVGD